MKKKNIQTIEPLSKEDYFGSGLFSNLNESKADSKVIASVIADDVSFLSTAGSDGKIRYIDLKLMESYTIGQQTLER